MKIIEWLIAISMGVVVIFFIVGAYKSVKESIKDLNDKNKTP